MLLRLKGINKATARLASGETSIYYYHRATGTRLEGEPGTPEFIASYERAAATGVNRTAGTLAGLIREFEKSVRWTRNLAESTKVEYRRIFKFWDGRYGSLGYDGLCDDAFRADVLAWHAECAVSRPREADNRVTILAALLSWGRANRKLKVNVLDTFERAYSVDRSDMIWLPQHVEAFMAAADSEMRLAMMLALHTGQRQADIRKMAWSNYNGTDIVIRQGKGLNGKPGRRVTIPCTAALKETLDALPQRGALILTTSTGLAFTKRYFAQKWEAAFIASRIKEALHFHDIRGTTVTLLFEGGCTVAECAAITGHTLRRAQEILDRYLSRTRELSARAIEKFENVLALNFAKRPAKEQ